MTPLKAKKAHRFRVSSLIPWLASILIGLASFARADVNGIESDAEKWIELQTRTAQEISKWKAEKELLDSAILALSTERKSLEENLESNRLASELYQKNRDKLVASAKENGEALNALERGMSGFEEKIKSLYPRLPEPLRKDVEPMLRKVSASIDGEPISLATRIQSLVSVLTAVDQFNNSLNLAHQIRKNEDGSLINVRVLYWGLAVGYAVDGRGERAWVLNPGESEWTWSAANDLASDIRNVLDVYSKNASPRLISLPASLN